MLCRSLFILASAQWNAKKILPLFPWYQVVPFVFFIRIYVYFVANWNRRALQSADENETCSCSVNSPKNVNIVELSRPNIRLYEFNFNLSEIPPFKLTIAFVCSNSKSCIFQTGVLFHKWKNKLIFESKILASTRRIWCVYCLLFSYYLCQLNGKRATVTSLVASDMQSYTLPDRSGCDGGGGGYISWCADNLLSKSRFVNVVEWTRWPIPFHLNLFFEWQRSRVTRTLLKCSDKKRQRVSGSIRFQFRKIMNHQLFQTI